MEKIKQNLKKCKAWMQTPRVKKMFYLAIVVVIAAWVVFRLAVVAAQNRLEIYNPARAALSDGVPVEVIVAQKRSGVLREPITVKNNRAFISGARVGLLRPGQKIGDGKIVSVSGGIDLDTGMHAVRTQGVSDGLHYAEFNTHGYFVPLYAINNGVLFVAENGIAVPRKVKIERTDADTAYITSGIADGDVIILSNVRDGNKVRIKK